MNKAQRQRGGTVLIIVVVLVMLLSLIAYKYLLAMQTEHLITVVHGDRLQAKQSAESVRELLEVMLSGSRAQRDRWGGLTDNPAFFAGNTDAIQGITATENLTEALQLPPFGLVAYAIQPETDSAGNTGENADATAPFAFSNLSSALPGPFDPPTRYGAINESQKLHLWKLLQWERASPGAGVASLMSLPGMDQGTAEALMDWLDPDDEARSLGAESEFYATLSRPIAPRNGMPFELDELLFVKGVTPQRLYGTMTQVPFAANGSNLDSNWNSNPFSGALSNTETAVGSPNSFPSSPSTASWGAPVRPWVEMLTLYSAERNESYTGQRRIFVNQKDLSQLHQQLAARIPKEWADFIVLYRQYGPTQAATTSQVDNPSEISITIDLSVPAETMIESLVDLIGVTVSIPPEEEGEEAKLVHSPARTESLAGSNLEFVFDELTLTPKQRIIGRVNINEAPSEILGTLPVLSMETVQRILRARDADNHREQPHVHPIWLLTQNLIDPATMRSLLPDITCGGDVYRATVWGRATPESATYRFETVLDATAERCRSVYYRQLDASADTIKVLSEEEFASLGLTSANDAASENQDLEATASDFNE